MSSVLNPELYSALRRRFGKIKVTNRGIRRVEGKDDAGRPRAVERGEHYNLNCPLCGDRHGRLSVSHLWLTKIPFTHCRRVGIAHCYNEQCEEIASEEFWGPIVEDMELIEIGLLDPSEEVFADVPEAEKVSGVIKYPSGVVPLTDLPLSHPAIRFLEDKYKGIPVRYLNDAYGAGFTAIADPIYPLAINRVVFPIYHNNEYLAWQGRTIVKGPPRWYLPPGFVKVIYNADRVAPIDTPVLCEGITSAIAAGPKGIAIFGKTVTPAQLRQIKERWSAVIVALDPETFSVDSKGNHYANRLKEELTSAGVRPIMLRWPQELIELGARHHEDSEVKVPDPADLGPKEMHRLIQESVV